MNQKPAKDRVVLAAEAITFVLIIFALAWASRKFG